MERARSRRRLGASDVVRLPAGDWLPPSDQPWPGHLGFLVAKGLLVREIQVAGAWSVELLDRGDLLRPWIEDAASFVEARWRVIERAELLVLDVRRVPAGDRIEFADDLVDRALRRSRSMAVHGAISATRRVEDKVLLLLWHVAERRGHRGPRGVELDLPVTHESLGHVVGAKRPSVTTALQNLESQGALTRRGRGKWLLHGDPPGARHDDTA